METSDLKYPYIWEERTPCLEGKVLFVPDFYHDHEAFKMPAWSEIFENENPIALEYCSGNGQWILEKAQKHPDLNWIAVEWDFYRARQIFRRMHTLSLKNLFIVVGEGLTFSRHYLREAMISDIYVNFPDPWPKERHAKHRLIQMPFAEEALRTLTDGGGVTMVTDHPLYAEQMVATFAGHSKFRPYFPAPHYVTEWENYGRSYFGTLWRQKGLNIHYIKFEKDANHSCLSLCR